MATFALAQYEIGVTRAELMRIREDDAQRLRESWAAADARGQQRRLASRNAPKSRQMPQERCRSAGVPTSVFFTRVASDIDRAKSVCAGCPACERCLEGAKRRREKHGVWGGQVFPQAIKSERWLKRIERSLRRLGVASVVGRDFVYLDEETSEVRFGKVPLHRLSMFCNRLEDLAVLTVLAEATEDEGFLN